MIRKTLIAAAALAALFSISAPASAATEQELRTQCAASGGTLDTATSPWQCKHPGPQTGGPAAPAPTLVNTFTFEGATWTIVEGPASAVSAVHMFAGSAKACPSLKVKLEVSTKGPAQTAAQKARGDQRWHVVCIP